MASDSEEAPIARAVLITLAALALYVLSMGPVWRATMYMDTPPIWVDRAYYPIIWTARHCEPVNNALDWYLRLWLLPVRGLNAYYL